MANETFTERAAEIANQAQALAGDVASLAVEASRLTAESAAAHAGASTLVVGLTVFVLAVFVGYHVVWRVTQALHRSEEHTSELQSLMRISYAVFCMKKKNNYT